MPAAQAVGFSPRKAQMTLYIAPGFDGLTDELSRLGRHTLGKGCLYVKRLDAVDADALRERVARSLTLIDEI